MELPPEDVATKVSTEVAETHLQNFYQALESKRNTIASFYIPATIMPDGKSLPAILFNGNVIADANAMQDMFEKKMPPTHYESQSYDCQVINRNFSTEGQPSTGAASGKNMTILIVVSGFVKMGPLKEAEMRGFSETFVLIPNPDGAALKKRGKIFKEWLIQTQNFRLVV